MFVCLNYGWPTQHRKHRTIRRRDATVQSRRNGSHDHDIRSIFFHFIFIIEIVRINNTKPIVAGTRWADSNATQSRIDGQNGFAVCWLGLEKQHPQIKRYGKQVVELANRKGSLLQQNWAYKRLEKIIRSCFLYQEGRGLLQSWCSADSNLANNNCDTNNRIELILF